MWRRVISTSAATPKASLYKLWTPDDREARPLLSLLSTREDVYGESDDTLVPNGKLMDGLQKPPLRLISTLQKPDQDDGILAHEVAADARGPGGFEVQAPVMRGP